MGTPYGTRQLSEEVKTALGLAVAPRLAWEEASPYPRFLDNDVWMGLTDAQRTAFNTTCDAHVADPNWGEKQDVRTCRLFVSDPALDAFLALAPGTATAAQRDDAIQKLIRSQRALIRIVRGLAT